MPISALLLALAAALVHATWNLLVAGARDTRGTTAVALAAGCVALAPAAAATWRVETAALPYAAASAVLELAYFALLAVAYARDELSGVYPLARGSAPVLVLAGSAVALGAAPSAVQVGGVAVVAAGVLAVRGARGQARGAGLALAVGACIAAYTLVDKQGIRHAGPLPYLELVLVVPAIAYCVAMRGRLRSAAGAPAVLAGVGMVAAYALTLAALRLAAPAPVAAVRESSVVIGVCFGALFLGEQVGRRRLFGAVAVALGVAAVALG